MSGRKLLSLPARLGLPRMASFPGSMRAAFEAGRRSGAGFPGPCPVRLRRRAPSMVTSDTRCKGFPVARRPRAACRNRCGGSSALMMRRRVPVAVPAPVPRMATTFPTARAGNATPGAGRCRGRRRRCGSRCARGCSQSPDGTGGSRPAPGRPDTVSRLRTASRLPFGAGTCSPPAAVTARAIRRRVRIASAPPAPTEDRSSASRPERGASRCSDAGPQYLQTYEQTLPCRLSTYTGVHNMNQSTVQIHVIVSSAIALVLPLSSPSGAPSAHARAASNTP